jgi:hypothetical protein
VVKLVQEEEMAKIKKGAVISDGPAFVAAPANHFGWVVSRKIAALASLTLIKPVRSSSRDFDEVWK